MPKEETHSTVFKGSVLWGVTDDLFEVRLKCKLSSLFLSLFQYYDTLIV